MALRSFPVRGRFGLPIRREIDMFPPMKSLERQVAASPKKKEQEPKKLLFPQIADVILVSPHSSSRRARVWAFNQSRGGRKKSSRRPPNHRLTLAPHSRRVSRQR
jgi:hypothetical protein